MAKPEKHWQLLLVADDGRIIPLKRIKGIAVMLLILLILLGLVCAGLAWQLTAEKIRHHRTLDRLAEADRMVARYKGEHELITAELVLAEARMERAGLLIPKSPGRTSPQVPMPTADGQPVLPAASGVGGNEALPDQPAADSQPSIPAGKPPVAEVAKPPVKAAAPAQPAIELGDLELKHDAGKKTLLARFRVKSTRPRSSPVAGRCVVVLKDDPADPAAWLAMPSVNLVNGIPTGDQGQSFRISRFMDLEIKAVGQTDPSSFKTASVHVFDSSGAKILEKDFAIDLPAPRAVPEPASAPTTTPTGEPPASDAGSAPAQLPTGQRPVVPQTVFEGSGEAAGTLPLTHIPDADGGAAPQPLPDEVPGDDPSLGDPVEPPIKEDARSRY